MLFSGGATSAQRQLVAHDRGPTEEVIPTDHAKGGVEGGPEFQKPGAKAGQRGRTRCHLATLVSVGFAVGRSQVLTRVRGLYQKLMPRGSLYS